MTRWQQLSTALVAWWSGRTLRSRLVSGVLLLLAVVFVGVGLTTTFALRGFLFNQLDQNVRTTAAGNGLPLLLEHGTVPNRFYESPGTFGAWIGQGAARACVQQQNDEIVLLPLSPSDLRQLASLPVGGPPQTVDLSTIGHYRVIALPGDNNDLLVTGLSLHDLTGTTRHLEVIELVVFAGALLLAGSAGAAWVRLSLRPLRRVAAVATTVAQLPLASGEVELSERVPDADPRTETGQVGLAFNRMLGHVEDALAKRQRSESRLRQFVADASHELRTPLAAIRSHAEYARAHGGKPDEVQHALGRVEGESERMGRLVDDMLLLARLDAGRPLANDEVDLTRLVIDVTSDARVAGRDHRWQLSLPDEPVTVRGDDHRLHQVLANLLANARIHTPPGTTVAVRLGTAADEPDHVELTVSDDGPGIPASLRPSVFERFVRGDVSRSRETGSTGLGLAIVAAVVSAHHGTVTVRSRRGETTFRVLLPRGRPTAAPPDGEMSASEPVDEVLAGEPAHEVMATEPAEDVLATEPAEDALATEPAEPADEVSTL